MALSDRLARDIADLKSQIDQLDAKHDAAKLLLQAKLQALRDLKQSWSGQLDALCNSAGVDFK